MGPAKREVAERFWSRVLKHPYPGCWEWQKITTHNGYGEIWVDGKMLRAHRVSWEMVNGKIPDGIFVLHKCDNPSCVNPSHLFLGTHQDNMDDCARKGRVSILRGENSPASILKKDQVLEIAKLTRRGIGCRIVAMAYGVSRQTVSDIRSGRNWGHLVGAYGS